MRRIYSVALATLTVLASCRTTVTPNALSPQPGPGSPLGQNRTAIPSDVLEVALNHVVGPTVNHIGDRFYATVLEPWVNALGEVVVPEGAIVGGRIIGLSGRDQVGEETLVRLSVDRISWRGRTRPFRADVISVTPQPVRVWQANVKAASPAPPVNASVTTTANLISVGSEPFLPVGARLGLRVDRGIPWKK